MNYEYADSIKNYLAKINHPILTKEEEFEIGKQIYSHNIDLVLKCIRIPTFLKRFLELDLFIQKRAENILKVSRDLNNDVSKKKLRKFNGVLQHTYKNIREFLDTKDPKLLLAIEKNIIQLSLTPNIIKKLLKPLTTSYTIVNESQKGLAKNLQKLRIGSQEILDKIVLKFLSSDFRTEFIASRDLSDSKLIQILTEQEMLLKTIKYEGDDERISELFKINDLILESEKALDKSRQKLITHNLRLVVSRVTYHKNKGLDFSDLIQEGNIGLMKAVDNFEYSRNLKFSTFAIWWIDQTIRRAIANSSQIIRIPVHIQDLKKSISRHVAIYRNQHGTVPPIQLLSKKCDIAEERILAVLGVVQQPLALDTLSNNDDRNLYANQDRKRESSIPDKTVNVESTVNKQLIKELINKGLCKLKERDQMLLQLKFGIGAIPQGDTATLDEIANKFGISKQRIGQLRQKLCKLKEPREILKLTQELYNPEDK